MRHRSKRFTDRSREAAPVRKALIATVGKCEVCGASPKRLIRQPAELNQLCVHEIARGPLRQKALDKPYACLVACFYCNQYLLHDRTEWPEARQLARLRKSRPDDYDLGAYNLLVNERAPNRITQDEVDTYQ